ncbi:MAG: redox-regulated ATPase YchF [Caldilineae bacterium]|nr:MAG: redox-regulated ATPase YchF [Caldilineae bacterium]
MEIGIIGLPNSGKTTVFNALTRGREETAAYSAAHMEVHTAAVQVPDERLDRLAEMYRPKKVTHAQVVYKDIAGLTRGIGEAGGLAGPLLNEIGNNDALLHVVRAFEDENVLHPEGSIDPARDIATVETELMLNDMTVITTRLERIAQRVGKGGDPREVAALKQERALLERLLAELEAERPLREVPLSPEEEKALRGFNFLSQKPMLIVLNIGDEDDPGIAEEMPVAGERIKVTALRGKLEAELAQMEPEEAADFMAEFGIEELGLSRVIHLSYDLLQVHSFFTVGEDEVRAWTLPVGGTALDAAATIHTDLARGFIRAEVVAFADLMAAGSLAEARKRATLRLEGKDYVVQDGEIVHIRFNV